MNKDHDYGGRHATTSSGRSSTSGCSRWTGPPRRRRLRAAAKGLTSEGGATGTAAAGTASPKPSAPAAAAAELLPRLVDPYDPKQDLTRRARSWLHANCSTCHVEAGGGNARMELEFATALDKMRVLDEKPLHTTFDLPDARLVAPGHPERSWSCKRVGTRGPGQMPPLSTNRIDEAGLALLREWIAAMKE